MKKINLPESTRKKVRETLISHFEESESGMDKQAVMWAKKISCKPQVIYLMKRTGYIPAKHCKAIEQLLGGKLKKEEMRPDVY